MIFTQNSLPNTSSQGPSREESQEEPNQQQHHKVSHTTPVVLSSPRSRPVPLEFVLAPSWQPSSTRHAETTEAVSSSFSSSAQLEHSRSYRLATVHSLSTIVSPSSPLAVTENANATLPTTSGTTTLQDDTSANTTTSHPKNARQRSSNILGGIRRAATTNPSETAPASSTANAASSGETGKGNCDSTTSAAAFAELQKLERWRIICIDLPRFRKRTPKMLKSYLREGITDCMRGTMWQQLIASRDIYKPFVYEQLVAELNAPCEGDIFRDISRTFPKHVLFRERGNVGQAALLNVLRAYSLYNPMVGYCQGMGFLVGLLLMYMNEEDAFYMMIALLSKFDMAGLFSPGLPLLEKYFFQFQGLLQIQLPQLAAHLEAENVDATMYASQWFMTVYTYNFSFDVVVRVWDIYLNEGIKMIFRVALAILKLQQDEIFGESFEQILHRLKSTPHTLEADSLIRTALATKVPKKVLHDLELQYFESRGFGRDGLAKHSTLASSNA